MLYIAAYTYGDVVGRGAGFGLRYRQARLGCSLSLCKEVVGVDIDRLVIKTACENAAKAGLTGTIQWINGDVGAVVGKFDTVLQNPPFGVQTREADRAFLVKALEVGSSIYSLHNHPEIDQSLIKLLKSSQGFVQVQPSPFLERFIVKHGGKVKAVYAMLMTIPKIFDFHRKLKHDFVIDLYIINN